MNSKKISTFTIYILLTLVVLALYYKCFSYPLIALDNIIDPNLKLGLSLSSIKWAFTCTHYDYWKPLTYITQLIDWQIYGTNYGGHHLTNVFIHILNVILLFKLTFIMFNNRLISFFIALLFAVHPMHIESVVWIVERKDVLSQFFALLTIFYYLKYLKYDSPKFYFISQIMFILGLMSKPMLVTVPFIIILVDFIINRDNIQSFNIKIKSYFHLIFDKIPYFIFSFIFAYITIIFTKANNSLQSFELFPVHLRLENSINSYLIYLWNFLIPLRTSIYHPFNFHINKYQLISAFLVLAMITIYVSIHIKKKPIIFAGWFWFIGTLVPVIGLFVQAGDQARADRFVYLPYLGLYIILVYYIFEKINYYKLKIILISIFSLYLFVISKTQINYWKNTPTLFKRAIQLDKNVPILYSNLAHYYLEQKNLDSAEIYYDKALIYNPTYVPYLYNKGMFLLKKKNYTFAKQIFLNVIDKNPSNIFAYISLGQCFLAENNDSLALHYFLTAYRIDPTNKDINYEIGLYYYKNKNLKTALNYFELSLKRDPFQIKVLNYLGLIYLEDNNFKLAYDIFQKQLKLNPNSPYAYYNLALYRIKIGQFKNAINITNYAIPKFPYYANLYINRANAKVNLNMLKSAKEDLIKAIELDSSLTVNIGFVDSLIAVKNSAMEK